MDIISFSLHSTIAFILGGIIGFEREWRHRLAGIRTNVLVCLGAFLFVTLSLLIDGDSSPTRLAAQVVSGIGFLGAGVIMKDGLRVRGLNTAATLWCSAAIGILTSSGFISYAMIGTLFILTANIFLRHLAQSLLRSHDDLHIEQIEYQIRIISNRGEDQHIRTFIL